MQIITDIMLLIPTVLITLNEALKRIFNMDTKYAIVVDLVGGTALYSLLAAPVSGDIREWALTVLTGFLLGASAGGLYDAAKPVVQKLTQ